MPAPFGPQFLRWLLALVLVAGDPFAAEDAPTELSFAQWEAACLRLPMNRELGKRRPPRAALPLSTMAPLNAALDAFFAATTNGPMASAKAWVGSVPRRDTFFNVGRSWFGPNPIPFEPFAQRLSLAPGDRVFLMGDLHGDIRSLLAVLRRLQELGWLDGFRVSAPGRHLVFLGDYTDRGQYGIEVIYTLLRLKNANPGTVHLVRGNHEDLNLVSRYGFLAEGEWKYGRSFDPNPILRAYDFLPVVLYVGTGNDFIQACHGGMEPGFDPRPLLAAPPDHAFRLLGPLRQATALRSEPPWLDLDPASATTAAREFLDFTPEAPTSPSVVGFLWNDFTLFADEPAFLRNPDRAYVYGSRAVASLMSHASRDGPRLRAVIRAHQHTATLNPMMRRLLASRGLYRHWQEERSGPALQSTAAALASALESGSRRSIPEHSVWTLNVSPDSVYGLGCGFGTATFAVLNLDGAFEDWRLDVETVDVVPQNGERR
ncbi:MAG: serine/threonine protein phosphatase [Verrucomicrobiae bacterium]|nr:serine/threonine protein phosphatase [Verrucomicrobiae bacterium]